MLQCIRCSAPNPVSALCCQACGTVLPRLTAQTDESDQLFTLEEGRSYPVPQETFDTENLAQLRMAIEDYLEGEGEAAQIATWVKHIRRYFQEFSSQGVTHLNQALDVERKLNDQGDFHHHVGYLVRKGSGLCEEGLNRLEAAVAEGNDQDLVPAFEVFRDGNDHICTALVMISERQELLEAAVTKFAPLEDAEES